MKTFLNILAGLGTILMFLALLSCTKVPQPSTAQGQEEKQEQKEQKETPEDDPKMPDKIKISISGETLLIALVNNDATKALVSALRQAPITYTASDYGGFEKVGSLGRSLPTSNSQITTQAGDVILYNGNQIVLFYGSNTWSYTRIGKMEYESMDKLKSFLKAGAGNISVTLSL